MRRGRSPSFLRRLIKDRNGLVRTHVGNKIASSPLIGTTTSVRTRCVAFDWIAFRQSPSKARSRETSNKRAATERGGRWGSREIEIALGPWFRGTREPSREGWELNKCLLAEICVPIFETPEFPRTAKWHHTFAALAPFLRLSASFMSLDFFFPLSRALCTHLNWNTFLLRNIFMQSSFNLTEQIRHVNLCKWSTVIRFDRGNYIGSFLIIYREPK